MVTRPKAKMIHTEAEVFTQRCIRIIEEAGDNEDLDSEQRNTANSNTIAILGLRPSLWEKYKGRGKSVQNMSQRLLSAILCCSRWRISNTHQEEGSRNHSARTTQNTSLRTCVVELCKHTD